MTCYDVQPHEQSAKPQLKNAIFGSKLSFLGLHYIVLQYILIASFASPGKLRAESLFTPPLQRLKHVGRSLDELSQRHAPCLSFIPQRLGSKPSPWSNAFALAIFI